MTKQSGILFVGLMLGALGVGATMFGSLSSCFITEANAKEMVVAELSRAGLEPKFLSGPTQTTGNCSFSFEYEGNGRQISYIVTDDLLHGPELHRWDYADGANGP